MQAKSQKIVGDWPEIPLQWIMTLVYSISAILFVSFFFSFVKRLYRFYKIRRNLRLQWSGPPSHWLWGHLGMVTRGNKDPKRFITWFTEQEDKYPVGFAIYSGPLTATLMLYHPNIVKEVLSLTAFDAPKHGGAYNSLLPWLGKGLLILNNWDWYRHRKLLTSAFHFDILKPYVKIMDDCSKTLVNKWSMLTSGGQTGSIEIFKDGSLLTLDTILKCLMGFESNCQNKNESKYIESIYRLSKLVVERPRSKNLLKRFAWFYSRTVEGKEFEDRCHFVHEIAEKMIRDRKSGNQSTKKDFHDFLDILIHAKDSEGNGLSFKDIRAEVDTFLFEGHDTTASALSWTLYCLSKNPEHQSRCYEEVEAVMRDRDEVKWRDLSCFPHLTRCIKESIRMFPPVPLILRHLNKDLHFEGRTILKGTRVQLSLIGVQRNKLFWKNPQKFDPDRFNFESNLDQNSHSFIPFSAGPRNCIGQHFAMNELKVILANILRKFVIKLDESKDIVPCVEVILRARGGIPLFIRQRR